MNATLPRPLRVLLAFLLVPLVLFANPVQASAATSGIMTFNLGPSGLERFSTECRVSWTLNSGGMVLGSSSRCDGGPDLSPGFCQPYEGDCGAYGLVLKDANGSTCGSAAFDPFTTSGNGTISTAAALGGGYIALDPTSCLPVQACLSYFFDPAIGSATDEAHCITVDLDLSVPPTGGACIAGTPHVFVTVERTVDGPYVAYHDTYVNFSVAGNTVDAARQWGAAVRLTPDQLDPFNVGAQNSDSGKVLIRRQTFGTDQPVATYPNAGVEFYAYLPEPAGEDVYWNRTPVDGLSQRVPETFPLNVNSPYYGITDAGQCRFYFGPKAVDDPTSDMDDPFGTADDPEPPDTGPDDPEPVVDPPDATDPGDGFDWLQAIWALLRSILTALGNLASSIIDGILDGLTSLFVPEKGFMDDSFSDISSEWEQTSLTKWVDAAGDITAGSAAGCGGLPLNVTLPGDVQVSENVGAACSGSMATAAGIVRIVLSAGLVVTGAFACIRGIGAGFGWSPSVGRGEA